MRLFFVPRPAASCGRLVVLVMLAVFDAVRVVGSPVVPTVAARTAALNVVSIASPPHCLCLPRADSGGGPPRGGRPDRGPQSFFPSLLPSVQPSRSGAACGGSCAGVCKYGRGSAVLRSPSQREPSGVAGTERACLSAAMSRQSRFGWSPATASRQPTRSPTIVRHRDGAGGCSLPQREHWRSPRSP